jgi:hypothetical protein
MAMKDFVKCCSCGMVFPADYFENWGRKYGKGLGPAPVCEALSTDYQKGFNAPQSNPELAMYPVGVCKGQVIPVSLPEETETAILADNDPFMTQRGAIMREVQRNKRPELKVHLEKIEAAIAGK